jgi:hypothetical protein
MRKTKNKNMKKVKLLMLIIAVACLASLNSCKKEFTGPAGPQGPAGTNGTNGTNGNANVHSTTFTASFTWDGANYWRIATISNISILTSSIVNSGAVMIYLNENGTYAALPMTVSMGGNIVEDVWFEYSTGQISIVTEDSDLSDPGTSTLNFKLVCIDASARMANPNVDLKNYNEVKKAFKLKD